MYRQKIFSDRRTRLLFIALLFTLGPACTKPPSDVSAISSLVMTDVAGETQAIGVDGRVTVVNFWATWCGPCIVEMPELQELADKYSPEDVLIVGISTDNLPEDEIATFVKELNISYPIVKDDGSAEGAAGPILGFPTTLVLDKQGREARRILGATTAKELELEVKALLQVD